MIFSGSNLHIFTFTFSLLCLPAMIFGGARHSSSKLGSALAYTKIICCAYDFWRLKSSHFHIHIFTFWHFIETNYKGESKTDSPLHNVSYS